MAAPREVGYPGSCLQPMMPMPRVPAPERSEQILYRETKITSASVAVLHPRRGKEPDPTSADGDALASVGGLACDRARDGERWGRSLLIGRVVCSLGIGIGLPSRRAAPLGGPHFVA